MPYTIIGHFRPPSEKLNSIAHAAENMSKTRLNLMNNCNRVVYGSGQHGGHAVLPEILEIGWGQFMSADRGHLRPHMHEDAFEFCLILSGEVEWCTRDSSEVLRAGDVYVTQPSESHWGRDTAMHPCTLFWLILGSPSHGFDWPDLDPPLARHLDAQLRQIRTHRLRGTEGLRTAFTQVFLEHKNQPGSPSESMLRRGSARAALHRLMIELVRTHDSHRAASQDDGGVRKHLSAASVQAIEALRHGMCDRDTIRHICRKSGTDYKTLNRQFLEHFGATIAQYSLRERVRLARDQLRQTNLSVTEIATGFGFSSSQHFATVFRRFTGLTPTECRAA